MTANSFKSKATLSFSQGDATVYRLDALSKAGIGDVDTLPYSMKILLENLLRNEDGVTVNKQDIEAVASWDPKATPTQEIAYRPSRVVFQDFTGVPAVVDLAAMREAFAELGGNPDDMNPIRPGDLVIDHSVQVDHFGNHGALSKNVSIEYQRNVERYQFLRWGQQAFKDLRVVPPGTGIVHQVNLEYLATTVCFRDDGQGPSAYPDTLVGTDSHTTMINGLGVVGWGVGGIEAEAAILGQPIAMLLPQVVGFELKGKLPEGATATDLVLTVTEMLRAKGVVGKFVEFFGDGLSELALTDRATIANMAPEYGATMGFFPADKNTIDFLRFTGRDEQLCVDAEKYLKEQGLFRTNESPKPRFTDTLDLSLADVVPSIAGPKRPQDRIALTDAKRSWRRTLVGLYGSDIDGEAFIADGQRPVPENFGRLAQTAKVTTDKGDFEITHGDIMIAAITSCTNTSNPSVMLAAGLLAKNARAKGLDVKPWVKTSLAPGSQVVTEYLKDANLLSELEALGFFVVGYGCTTCIGNSGPLHDNINKAVEDNTLAVSAVLSGNRNYEGRVSPITLANYLASPPLVVAYALAGTVDIDFKTDPIGKDSQGKDVFLKDIWPSPSDVTMTVQSSVKRDMFISKYADVFKGDAEWTALKIPDGNTFDWKGDSTYIRKPTFFDGIAGPAPIPTDIVDARCLALLGDTVTTDHISPAGSIKPDSPAGRYLQENGVEIKNFNSYGSRRGNHEVMMRGTFANIRLRNLLAPGTEGGETRHLPKGTPMSIFDASMKYQADNIPLVVIAGKEYGTGSSRDWAAKGTLLLGIKAVIAESYERIHRSNLVGMGVLPLQFKAGQNATSLGLSGEETFSITGITGGISPMQTLNVSAGNHNFEVILRIDTPQEIEYVKAGGILSYVLRERAKQTK